MSRPIPESYPHVRVPVYFNKDNQRVCTGKHSCCVALSKTSEGLIEVFRCQVGTSTKLLEPRIIAGVLEILTPKWCPLQHEILQERAE